MTANRAVERDTRAPMPVRIWGRTRDALESLGRDEKFARTTLIGDTAEILAGAIHCARCGEPVPVVMGDCTGRPLRAWVTDATTAVYRQKCKDHQPVPVGAEAASQPPSASGTAGEAAAREQDAQGRTEPPAPVPAQARKAAPRQKEVPAIALVATGASLAPAVPFMAGPDVDCVHENFRGVKGVCPDCKQWVKP